MRFALGDSEFGLAGPRRIKTRKRAFISPVKPAITKTTKTKKAAIPAAIERAIARAIAKNETKKAAIAEASPLMKLPCIEEPSMKRIFCVVVI